MFWGAVMALDIQNLTSTMAAAFQGVLQGSRANIQTTVIPELQSFTRALARIETGGFSPGAAKMLLDEQRESLKDVLIGTLDIEETLAQNAINAALQAIAQTVNTAVKFPLLAVA
jgi:hypothetical protein